MTSIFDFPLVCEYCENEDIFFEFCGELEEGIDEYRYQYNDRLSMLIYHHHHDNSMSYQIIDDGEFNEEVFDNAIDAFKWCKEASEYNVIDEEGWLVHPSDKN